MKYTCLVGLAATLLASSVASAAPVKYTVTNQETLNVATVESETDLENFTGVTNKISGTVTYDAVAKTGSADITVDGASIKTGQSARDDHMRGKNWLNFEANPKITYKTKTVTHLGSDRYRVTGDLTMNGVTKPVSAEATVKLTPANDTTRQMKLQGDALAVTVKFSLKLSDFNVNNPSIKAGRVSNTLPVTLKFIATNGK